MATSNPPDGFVIVDPANIVWGTHIDQDNVNSESGENVIDFLAVAAPVDPELETDFIAVEAGKYYAEARVKASSNAGGENVRLFVSTFDENRVLLGGPTAIHNAPALTFGPTAWETVGGFISNIAGKKFYKLHFGKAAGAAFSVQFDSVGLKPASTGLQTVRTGGVQAIAAGVFTTVTFGGVQTNTMERVAIVGGTGVMTILRPGYYHVSARVGVLPQAGLPNGDHDIAIAIVVNGVVLGVTSRLGAKHFIKASGGTLPFPDIGLVATGIMPLVIGDTVEIQVNPSYAANVADSVQGRFDIARIDTI